MMNTKVKRQTNQSLPATECYSMLQTHFQTTKGKVHKDAYNQKGRHKAMPVLTTRGSQGAWSLSQGTRSTGHTWTRCQSITGHNHTHYRQFGNANQPIMHVFGLGEETGVPGGNP